MKEVEGLTSASDCAAPDVSSCAALLSVFRICDQARTLQYILLGCSAAAWQQKRKVAESVQRLAEELTLTYGSLGKCVHAISTLPLFCFSSAVSEPDVHHVC